jgi:hypothetical protein
MSPEDAAAKVMGDLNTDGEPGLAKDEFRPFFNNVSAQLGMKPMSDADFDAKWESLEGDDNVIT